MADQFIEGFDKYGPTGMGNGLTNLVNLLTASEWNSANAGGSEISPNFQIINGLSSPGNALRLIGDAGAGGTPNTWLAKTLSGSLSRVIIGMRIASNLASAGATPGIVFQSAGAAQVSVVLNSNGTFSVKTGVASGSSSNVLATSSVSISQNVPHYLEIDMQFGTSGAYAVYLDGASILAGSGNTAAAGGTTANAFALWASGNGAGFTEFTFDVDDLYVFDTTGSVSNGVLLTSPRVETQYPTSDSAVAFSAGMAIVGQDYSLTKSTNAPGGNTIFMRQFTPPVAMSIVSITLLPMTTNASAHFQGCVYSDSGGAPNALITTTSTVAGCTSSIALSMPMASPQSLTAGTPYWIGGLTDLSVPLAQVTPSGLTGVVKANTFASGAPSTISGMTSAQPDWLIVGECSSAAHNFASVDQNPPVGDDSYVTSSTAAQTDVFNFPTLSNPNSNIYTVAMKAYAKKTDGGVRTANLAVVSSSTTGVGSASSIALSTAYGWVVSFFDKDPATGIAWTHAAVNAATAGYEVAT